MPQTHDTTHDVHDVMGAMLTAGVIVPMAHGAQALPSLMPGFDKEIARLAQRVLINPRNIDFHTNVLATKVTPGAPVLLGAAAAVADARATCRHLEAVGGGQAGGSNRSSSVQGAALAATTKGIAAVRAQSAAKKKLRGSCRIGACPAHRAKGGVGGKTMRSRPRQTVNAAEYDQERLGWELNAVPGVGG